MIIAVTAPGALLMATEFPDDPEVDLGFRDPATENSIRESAEEWKPQMELRLDYEPPISKERLSNPWWSLRITVILFLSALGGLISSIFFFERAERPSMFKHWKRNVYVAAKTMEEPAAIPNCDFQLGQLSAFPIGDDLGDLPMISQPPDQALSVQQSEPFDVAVRLPLCTPPSVSLRDLSEPSEMVASQKIGSEAATQTRSTVRATAEKTQKRHVARFKRRLVRRASRSVKSIASFWSIWSRHFFLGSGLASTSSRRVAARRSLRRRTKATLWFPLSWQAAAGQPMKKAIPADSATRSRGDAGRRFQRRESDSRRLRAP